MTFPILCVLRGLCGKQIPLQKLLDVGIRISPRWQRWLRAELDKGMAA
jgi:hypothetical protein